MVPANALYRDVTYKTPPEQNAPLISTDHVVILLF